jgi:hypothetical protein
MFGYYGIGLALGFFLYYILFVILIWAAPAEVLLSMGLVQEREVKPGGAASDAGVPVPCPDSGIMGRRSDEPFIEVR